MATAFVPHCLESPGGESRRAETLRGSWEDVTEEGASHAAGLGLAAEMEKAPQGRPGLRSLNAATWQRG